AHLVGHSYGAFLSLLLAMRQPDYVRTLVLAEPPAITLFVSNNPKPLEILKLLVSRPRTAAAIIKFGAKGVTPAIK
ncbi:MAG: alpha/beta fold hydrolase, partial [Aliifodinibius sp.]|nr:alpha/beta fold hydrolase [Fodinibius sp.]NIV15419.1 alpha/beta fold hydrolase [Fodinibius sp.]NIY29274.1 alpha/beta fold hydrolase [Fodinibius sp.]